MLLLMLMIGTFLRRISVMRAEGHVMPVARMMSAVVAPPVLQDEVVDPFLLACQFRHINSIS